MSSIGFRVPQSFSEAEKLQAQFSEEAGEKHLIQFPIRASTIKAEELIRDKTAIGDLQDLDDKDGVTDVQVGGSASETAGKRGVPTTSPNAKYGRGLIQGKRIF